ncbi:MAG TPA: isoprenylcysteine carboxylmethyltransferase family protein [Anaerolineae bacterium]
MSNETIFRVVTFFLFVAVPGISGFFRNRAERRGGRMTTDEGQRPVLFLRLAGLIFFLPLLGYLVNPDWVAWARVILPPWVRWLGALGGALSIPLGYWVFHSLGLNVSPTQATREGHKLVTHGPYHWVRHPLYTVGFFFWLSIILLTGIWWMAPWLLAAGAFILWRTPREEAKLIETFGDEYRLYMKRTGRYLPRLS